MGKVRPPMSPGTWEMSRAGPNTLAISWSRSPVKGAPATDWGDYPQTNLSALSPALQIYCRGRRRLPKQTAASL